MSVKALETSLCLMSASKIVVICRYLCLGEGEVMRGTYFEQAPNDGEDYYGEDGNYDTGRKV